MKPYRPKNFKNPYHKTEKALGTEVARNEYPQFEVFEAGADAMLKAIRARGYILGESLRTAKDAIGWANINPDSKWYPIPDEE